MASTIKATMRLIICSLSTSTRPEPAQGEFGSLPPNDAVMAELRYAVLLELEADRSAFNVTVPALPEIATFGATVEQALRMAREAIELSLEYRRDKGLEIPPSDGDDMRLERISVTLPAA